MAEQEPAPGCPRGKQQLPAFTWEVRANDRSYHRQVRKKFAFCLSKRKYSGNAIRTAKYNLLTFLPLNLYEQFHRMANVYFVFVILLQTFPEISTLPWYTLLFPLSCLLIIRGLRDLIDDIGRHRSDRSINSRPCEILAGRRFCWREWRDICVGDIVRLRKDSVVPADLLLLCSSEPSSLCYVETADIDGETNLKFRQALLVTHQELQSEESMAAFDGESAGWGSPWPIPLGWDGPNLGHSLLPSVQQEAPKASWGGSSHRFCDGSTGLGTFPLPWVLIFLRA